MKTVGDGEMSCGHDTVELTDVHVVLRIYREFGEC